MCLTDELLADLEENYDSNRMVEEPEPDFISLNISKFIKKGKFLLHIVFCISITFINFFSL